jgi:hypothetical protein
VDFLAAVSRIGGARRRCSKKTTLTTLTTHPRPYALATHIQLPDTSISAAAIGSIAII